jgi:hypothetical protein
MSYSNGKTYIPYLPTAEACLEADESPDLFLRSLVPDASDEQIEKFRYFILGILHDGIMLGLDICGHDPIGEVESYQLGVEDGLNRRQET